MTFLCHGFRGRILRKNRFFPLKWVPNCTILWPRFSIFTQPELDFSTLNHLFYLVRAVFWVTAAFLRANWHLARRAILQLDLPFPAALTSKDVRRLQHYYYGTTYLSSVFCALRGRWRSPAEKRLFTNCSALSFFFDDLVDDFKKHGDEEENWQGKMYEFAEASDERGLAVHFLHNIYLHMPTEDVAAFKSFMKQVFEVQFEGRRQRDIALGMADLKRLTRIKGGYSVLMFRRLLTNKILRNEQQAILEFGYLMQLADDIFDLWHDRQAGVRTLATITDSTASLSQIFEEQVATVRVAFRKTDFPKIQIETALCILLGIISVTRVCLSQYHFWEKKLGALPLEDRGKMVCDMEKWQNIARAGWGCLRNR